MAEPFNDDGIAYAERCTLDYLITHDWLDRRQIPRIGTGLLARLISWDLDRTAYIEQLEERIQWMEGQMCQTNYF